MGSEAEAVLIERQNAFARELTVMFRLPER